MTPPRLVVVAHNIRSMANVGSLFRSADAFGVAKIFLCGYTGIPPRNEIAKVALGAETWIPWEHAKLTHRVVERLQREGYTVVALECTKQSVPLSRLPATKKIALIVGNEVQGVSKPILKRAEVVAHIPMLGKKESLNVGVAAGCALYAVRYGRS